MRPPAWHSRPPQRRLLRSAFSLVELMVVVGIILLLGSLLAPSLSMMTNSSLTNSVDGVTGAFEFARQQAMVRRTYTFLGFEQKPGGDTSTRQPLVRIGVVSSRDGTADTSAGNLRPLSKLQTIRGAVLTSKAELSEPVKKIATDSAATTVSFSNSSSSLAFNPSVTLNNVITFTPDGSVILGIPTAAQASTQGFDEIIDVGIRQAKNATPPANAPDACVYLYGANGRIRVLRPF